MFSAIYAGIPITTEIELGTNYTITVDSITGYYGTLSRSYIARYQNVNNVIFQYAQSGIYVLSTDGYFVTADNWNTDREDAVGVAVMASNHAFVVSLEKYYGCVSSDKWSSPCSGAIAITDLNTAKQRFSGASDTTLMINTYGAGSDTAQGIANAYQFKNGKKGYLPSMGELNIMFNNVSAVDACLSKIKNGQTISNDDLWSSTYYGLYGNVYCFWSLVGATYRYANTGRNLKVVYSL